MQPRFQMDDRRDRVGPNRSQRWSYDGEEDVGDNNGADEEEEEEEEVTVLPPLVTADTLHLVTQPRHSYRQLKHDLRQHRVAASSHTDKITSVPPPLERHLNTAPGRVPVVLESADGTAKVSYRMVSHQQFKREKAGHLAGLFNPTYEL